MSEGLCPCSERVRGGDLFFLFMIFLFKIKNEKGGWLHFIFRKISSFLHERGNQQFALENCNIFFINLFK